MLFGFFSFQAKESSKVEKLEDSFFEHVGFWARSDGYLFSKNSREIFSRVFDINRGNKERHVHFTNDSRIF